MKTISFLILLAAGIPAIAQPTNKTDWEKEMLTSRVRYIKTTNYILPQAEKDITGIKQHDYNIDSFNTNGYRVKYYHVDSGRITSSVTYTYDSKNMLTERVQVARETTRIAYMYYPAASKVEQVNYKADGSVGTRIISTYDSSGNVVDQESKGFIHNRCVMMNDDKGRPQQMFCYGPDEKLENKLVLMYDAQGRKTRVDNFGPDGKLQDKTLYKYDDKGNETELVTLDANGIQTTTEITRYDYDLTGNWVKLIKTDATGVVKTAVSRELFYY